MNMRMLVKRFLRALTPSSKVAKSLTSLARAQQKIKFLSQIPKLMSKQELERLDIKYEGIERAWIRKIKILIILSAYLLIKCSLGKIYKISKLVIFKIMEEK